MDPPAASTSRSLTKPTFACTRCSERKVRCNKQTPCNACVRYNVQCISRPLKPSRKKRDSGEGEALEERLKRYEALLQEKGIDPNQTTATSEAVQRKSTRDCLGAQEGVRQLPTPALIASASPATIFKPQLLHGQGGTKLVDK